jgi:hypothetical protein
MALGNTASDDSGSQPMPRRGDKLIAFLSKKAQECRAKAKVRRDEAACLCSGTDAEWREAAVVARRMGGDDRIKAKSKAERKKDAEIAESIAAKYDREAENYDSAVVAIEEGDDAAKSIQRLAKLLERTINVVRGAPEPMRLHGWSTLPEEVALLKEEHARLARERDDVELALDGVYRGDSATVKWIKAAHEDSAEAAILRERLTEKTKAHEYQWTRAESSDARLSQMREVLQEIADSIPERYADPAEAMNAAIRVAGKALTGQAEV